jgi:hypothetical protein
MLVLVDKAMFRSLDTKTYNILDGLRALILAAPESKKVSRGQVFAAMELSPPFLKTEVLRELLLNSEIKMLHKLGIEVEEK